MVELHGGIVGRDPETLERFYTGVMGFTVAERRELEAYGTVLLLGRDDARLKLFFPAAPLDPPQVDDPWFRSGGWRYAALLLAAPGDVDDLAAACASGGGRVLIAPTAHRPDARMALVTDPEGNPWELLCECGPVPDAEPERKADA